MNSTIATLTQEIGITKNICGVARNLKKLISSVPAAYVVLAMFLTSVSLLLTVIVLNLYHHHPYTRVPSCLRAMSFGCFARLLCVDVAGANGNRKGKIVPVGDGKKILCSINTILTQHIIS